MSEPLGRRKGIERVGLGSWFQVDDDGTPKWVCVHMVHRGTLNATGRKITKLFGLTADGEAISFIDHDNELVTALTKAEAKKAGFVDPKLAIRAAQGRRPG